MRLSEDEVGSLATVGGSIWIEGKPREVVGEGCHFGHRCRKLVGGRMSPVRLSVDEGCLLATAGG